MAPDQDKDEKALISFLDKHQIDYERFDHPPVYTVEDVNRLLPDVPAASIKNLFLRDGKGKRHFLVVMPGEKRLDIKALGKKSGIGRMSFGSKDRLQRFLGVTPGAVTLLAVINDPEGAVEVLIDETLWKTAPAFQFHPMVNTSTLVFSRQSVEQFLNATGRSFEILEVPSPPE
jgi:Ala-tRNA(Pro) deacylase